MSFSIRHDHYIHLDVGQDESLSTVIASKVIAGLGPLLQQQGATEMASLDDIRAAVQEQRSATQGAVMLIQQLAVKLRDALANDPDPAALQAIVDDLHANAQSLADAITANTPAAGDSNPDGQPVEQPPAEQPAPTDQAPAEQPAPTDQNPSSDHVQVVENGG